MSQSETDREKEREALLRQPFVAHLIELRDRLIRVIAIVAVVFLVLFPFANDLFVFLAEPLMRHLPHDSSMIATEVASPFLTPFKLALIVAIFITMPYLIYQFWAFVAPGLYQHERGLAWPLLLSSILLFYVGMAFAYYVVFPLVFAFLTSMAPEGVAVMTDISKYLDFVLKMFFAFGLAFEVPIATIILVSVGATTPDALSAKRPYIIVFAFVLGMLLTPPDIISQTLLALPMWILFEIGLFLSRRFYMRKKEEDDDDSAATPGKAEERPMSTAAGAAGTADESVFSDPSVTATEDGSDYRPMTPEEMEAELERMEREATEAKDRKDGQ